MNIDGLGPLGWPSKQQAGGKACNLARPMHCAATHSSPSVQPMGLVVKKIKRSPENKP